MSSLTVISRIVPISTLPENLPNFFTDFHVAEPDNIQTRIFTDEYSKQTYRIETIYCRKNTNKYNCENSPNFVPLTPDSELSYDLDSEIKSDMKGFCFSVPVQISQTTSEKVEDSGIKLQTEQNLFSRDIDCKKRDIVALERGTHKNYLKQLNSTSKDQTFDTSALQIDQSNSSEAVDFCIKFPTPPNIISKMRHDPKLINIKRGSESVMHKKPLQKSKSLISQGSEVINDLNVEALASVASPDAASHTKKNVFKKKDSPGRMSIKTLLKRNMHKKYSPLSKIDDSCEKFRNIVHSKVNLTYKSTDSNLSYKSADSNLSYKSADPNSSYKSSDSDVFRSLKHFDPNLETIVQPHLQRKMHEKTVRELLMDK